MTPDGFSLPASGTEIPWEEPDQAFLRLADEPGLVFLDSNGPVSPRARWSFLASRPRSMLTITREGADIDGETSALSPWDAIDHFWRAVHRAPVAGEAPFRGGLLGFIGYELGLVLEHVPRAARRGGTMPDAVIGAYDFVLAFDRAARRCFRYGELPRTGACGIVPAAPDLVWRAEISRAEHERRVALAREAIVAGDIYQANVTTRFCAAPRQNIAPAALYLALRARNPAPFSAYLAAAPGLAVASVSPERFLTLSKKGSIEARPIKGTRARGETAAADAALAAALLASAKDRAENLMIVDLLRNDIAKVAIPGSVRVPALFKLERFAHVMHLVSVVTGRLAPGRSALDLLRSAFPGGSITGAPKIRAMQIISALEQVERGPYCGAVFWLGWDGAMDANIAIRTVTITPELIVAQAGGGIVADSDPAEEYDEMRLKVRPLLEALGRGPP